MINYKPEYKLMKDTERFIDFFNVLEKELESCSTDEERKEILDGAETELIMWGKI